MGASAPDRENGDCTARPRAPRDCPRFRADRFSHPDRKVVLSPEYREAQLRAEFLNPLFTALGWDMENALETILARNRGSVPLSSEEMVRALRGDSDAY